jgi:hypothetical protein
VNLEAHGRFSGIAGGEIHNRSVRNDFVDHDAGGMRLKIYFTPEWRNEHVHSLGGDSAKMLVEHLQKTSPDGQFLDGDERRLDVPVSKDQILGYTSGREVGLVKPANGHCAVAGVGQVARNRTAIKRVVVYPEKPSDGDEHDDNRARDHPTLT